jgi:hypothetical protein
LINGASKFVRGDAIAGIMIVLVNIVGGIIIGTIQKGKSLEEAADDLQSSPKPFRIISSLYYIFIIRES